MTKLILFFFSILCFTPTQAAVLKGTVTNISTNAPVAFATIISSQNSQTIMTNEDGSFILYLKLGKTNISCSHIAYYTSNSEIKIDKDTVEIEIILNPSLIVLPSISVYDRNYDAAQTIIIEAIRHKDKILAKLKSYSFDAYTKLFVSYEPEKDSLTPFLLTETELTAHWKYPSSYKEIITARKQSSNVKGNTVTIDEVLNFNNNRVNIGKYSFVTPTAKDALEYYNYYLLDTLFYDTLPVFLLEVEPKSNTTPLFIGTIQINAHTYEIMGVDFTINKGLDSRYLKKLQLVQEFQLFDEQHWMPVILKYNGVIDVPIPLIPSFTFAYTAALQRYEFDTNFDDTLFKYKLEVAENADDFDSTQWLANRFIPLTQLEEEAYQYIDTAKFDLPFKLKLMAVIPAVLYGATNNPDLFHFNKVEGAYLGNSLNKSLCNDKINLNAKLGYAFDAKLWQQNYSVSYTPINKHEISLRASYHDNIQQKKTINSSSDENATGLSLFFKHDPFDYYREKGFTLSTSFKPSIQSNMTLSYNNLRQFSIHNNSDYSLFSRNRTYRKNPAISDGTLKSIKLAIRYDSNKRMKLKGKSVSTFSYPYSLLRFGVEISDSSLLNSDFEFTTLYAQFYTSRQLFSIGTSSFGIYATTKLSGDLPLQRYTIIDYGANILHKQMRFKTLYHRNFSGNNLMSVYCNHDFGTKLFKKSHLPIIKKIPYSLSIHGGLFWSELVSNKYNTDDNYTLQTGKNPYSEIGFTIGRLPLMTRLSLSWQLSDYQTDTFYIGIGIDFFN